MTRYLKVLGLALVASLALSAIAASAASGASALFTANVAAGETAKAHGSQVGADAFTINGLVVTCATATAVGEAVTAGPSSTYGKAVTTYETCHVVVPFIGTRTVTITTNGCINTETATKNANSSGGGPTPGIVTPFSVDVEIQCPTKPIEIHIYNTSNHNDASAAVLCTYEAHDQKITDQIQLTNISEGVPSHILAHTHASIALVNKTTGGICGSSNLTAIHKGTETGTATNAAGTTSVNTSVS